MPTLNRIDNELRLSLSGSSDFQGALSQVKAISGRRFDPETKLWCFPAEPSIAERILFTVKPQADAALLTWVRASRAEREAELTTKLPTAGQLLIPWADKLYQYQKDAVAFMLAHPRMILADDLGLGKANAATTPVLTPSGWTTMSALKVGDEVIGSNGEATEVLGVFPQGVRPLYRVTFSDGSSVLATEEHLWSAKTPNDWKRGGAWRTVSTRDLHPVKGSNGNRRWAIPLLSAPVQFVPSVEPLPLDPYTLGVLLGDGSFRSVSTPSITCHIDDAEIIGRCDFGADAVKVRADNLTYGVLGGCTRSALAALGLWGHTSLAKFIPEMYLRAAPLERLALLQGLMDTDGYNQNGRDDTGSTSAEIAVSSSQLANGIQELVWSLGGTARRRIKQTTHADSYRITVKLPSGMNPFQMQRKAARYTERSKYPLRARYIASVEYEQDGEAVCIRVAASDSLYVTEDYIVTHNTLQALSAVAEYLIAHSEIDTTLPRLIVCPNSAKEVWHREIVKWLGKAEPLQVADAVTPKKRLAQIEAGIEAGAWVIVNYEQIRMQKHTEEVTTNHRDGTVTTREETKEVPKQPLFRDTEWLAVIADEAHRAKNRKASQTKGLHQITGHMQLALTGTPIMNNPAELWALLRWLYPDQYGRSTPGHPRTAFWSFHDQYTDSYEGYKNSRIVVGVKNPDALRFELKERLVRRTKQDELDLPDKTRVFVPVVLGAAQRKLYDEAETAFWLGIEQAILEGDKAAANFAEQVLNGKRKLYELSNGASRVVRLRQVASTPALLGGMDDSAKLDAVEEAIVDNDHLQHIVFSEFVGTCGLLVQRLAKRGITAEAYTGHVTDTRVRAVYEDRFQSGDLQVLVGTIPAMGESLTLTASSTVHFIERSWTPARNEQAEDRAWRVGQKNAVTIFIYEAQDTVDTDRVKVTNALKESIVASVIKRNTIKEAA